MKGLLAVVLLCVIQGYQGFSQNFKDVNIFSNLSGYRNVGYENNFFTKIDLGLGLLSKSRFSPEIGLSGALGSPQDQFEVLMVSNAQIEEQVRTQFSSVLLSLGLITRITQREEYWVFIATKFHFGNAKIRSQLFRGEVAATIPLVERLENKEKISFLDIGIGMEGYLDENEHWTGAISLVYTTLNSGSVIEDLNFQESDQMISTPSAGGIGITFTARYHL